MLRLGTPSEPREEVYLQPPTRREVLSTAAMVDETLTPEEEELMLTELSMIFQRLIQEDLAAAEREVTAAAERRDNFGWVL